MSHNAVEAAFVERTIQSSDGLCLYGRDYAPAADTGRTPIICLHGLTRNSRDFEELAPRMASLGRRVIALDMRGRGRSDYDPIPTRYLPPIYAGDVGAWMESLQISKAIFVGTSMGGIIAMILAALAPDRVAAAVLNDVGPRLEQAALDRIAGYVGKVGKPASDWQEAAVRSKLVNGAAFPKEGQEFWDRFARRTYVERDIGLVLDYDVQIAAPFAADYSDSTSAETPKPQADLTPYFDALAKNPLLVVRGGISDLLSDAGLAFMQARAPHMRSVTAPDVGHAPYMTEPVVWSALVDFLQQLP